MNFISKVLICFVLFSVFFSVLIRPVYGVESVNINVGETQNRKVYIFNPSKSLTDSLNLKITSTGRVNAWVTSNMANRLEFEVAPQENKSIPITLIATACTEDSCDGTVDFMVSSNKTGNSVSKKLLVKVHPKRNAKVVGSAPGLSWPYLLIIGLLGALLSISILKAKKKI